MVRIDFRTIPLGDIDLQREIRLGVNVVDRWRERTSVRRVYAAKIEGRTSDMTVTVYQGNTAEEQWRQGVLQLSSLRHPNIVQLYGVASSSGIHAAVYHGDLIPFERFLDHYRPSHFLTLDVWDYFLYVNMQAFVKLH
ncbi:hypothetical protein B0H12DRAFT_101513 [Mycena haematopus]|nr:hypothetical protein B0H12DRAFT_101513 [Mycena haematopus]